MSGRQNHSRGRRRGGRGRGGSREGRGGRGGRGYDWTRHLPPDHPRRQGLGPDPSAREGDDSQQNSAHQNDHDVADNVIQAEYAAYYDRQNARRSDKMEQNRHDFERVAAHARAQSSHQDVNSEKSETGAAATAARRMVESMSEEEREAAIVRHEEREARTKYAVDLKPERLRLQDHIRTELQKAVDDLEASETEDKKIYCEKPLSTACQEMMSSYFAESLDDNVETYRKIVLDQIQTNAYQNMQKQRQKLPAYQMKKSIADTLLSPTVTIAVISGETGCGKTTQVPRILSEAASQRGMGRLNILVAQPRRIAAVGVAERVAEEGGTGFRPGEDGCDVGYHIRHEKRVGRGANTVFCTTGVVLRILAGDPMLRGVDTVIVDEVHERSSDGDFLVTVLKDLVTGSNRGPGSDRPLKLLLMSATVDADFFVNYLSTSDQNDVPVLHIPGVAHPVRDFYLEDAIHACQGVLQSSGDMFELPLGGGKSGWKGKKRNTGGGRRPKLDGDSNEKEGGEASVRARRHACVLKQYESERTASLVSEFDLKSKISEKDTHLKSVSSGELPLGLAYHMVLYLDDLHRKIDNGDGAILVFLPGYDDISKLKDAFEDAASSGMHTDKVSNLHVLALHGSMPTSEQREIFRKPPSGKRKVVISTNVAESSITIDDVVYCLDLGKHKEKTYDPQSNIECLLPTWISKASARQRRGRAGRVRSGECWHLYPSWYVKVGEGIGTSSLEGGVPGGDDDPEVAFVGDVKLRAFALPEMLRTPLEHICLRARHLGLASTGAGGVELFLSKCPSSPGPLSLHNAMEALGPSDMMLLESKTEKLTPMGMAVASIPAAPRFGLALMLADHLGCEEEVLTICAILSGRPLFYAPFYLKIEADKAKRRFAEDIPSDLYASVRAYGAWEHVESSGQDSWSFCRSNFISKQAMLTARKNRKQLSRDLEASKRIIFKSATIKDTKSITTCDDGDRVWQQWGRVMGVLAAAFGSHLARLDHEGSGKCRCPIYTKSHGRVKLFPSCVSSPEGAAKEIASRGTTYYMHQWGLFIEKIRITGGICLFDINEISPLAIAVCVSGERRYSQEDNPNDFIKIDSTEGKVMWSDLEVDAMMSRRKQLVLLMDRNDLSNMERVGAQVEIEDIEQRLGILELVGLTKTGPGGDDDIDTRVLHFVVSALETNGGMYSMAGLRRMMKADRELYDAMGPVRRFADMHSSILSLDKMGGKWMFVLKPGARQSIQKGKIDQDENCNFYGPKTWIYFDMEDNERECIEQVRKRFREIVNARVGGNVLSPQELRFIDKLGWALQESFTKNQ